ncbi:DUF6461 domain-containing protein [Streptomyces sp. Da 82-17]|uniref:DUF6461 domain-containing protein n=1 Tax=Streptomyces sp. Da 82-17 TaxID=3377116 RepID=UPI0038D43266
MESGPWSWAQDSRVAMWCLTFTRGVTPQEVLARYGADPEAGRLLDRRQAAALGHTSPYDTSVLRAGPCGDWSFCFEEDGTMGSMSGSLAALSKGTETVSLLRGADGMNVFAHWRDGSRAERFEPAHTRPEPPHPWWDAVQEQLDASREPSLSLIPVLEAVAHHVQGELDTDTLNGPLLTVLLDESQRTPDPSAPGSPRTTCQPVGRVLGGALPGGLSGSTQGRALGVSATPTTHSIQPVEPEPPRRRGTPPK